MSRRLRDPRCGDCGDLAEHGGGCVGAQPGEFDVLKCHVPLGAAEGRQSWPDCDCERFLCSTCRDALLHAKAIARLLSPRRAERPAGELGATRTPSEVSEVQDTSPRASRAPDGGPWPAECDYLEDDHLGV